MRYYGNKTKLLDFISNNVNSLPVGKDEIFFDLFTGTTSVAKRFKAEGYRVYANDFLNYSYALSKCFVEINSKPSFRKIQDKLGMNVFEYLNSLNCRTSFITKNYSPYKTNHRQYFSVSNAKKIDEVRELIDEWYSSGLINEQEFFYLLTSLLNAINLVSNVSGTYGSFLKSWDNRALKPLKLEEPEIIPSDKDNRAYKNDARDVVGLEVGVLYIDPPYNSRQYASNYFIPELIAEGWSSNKPEIYGYTGMRPYDHQKSELSMKGKALGAFSKLIELANARFILLSYNNEGILSLDQIVSVLSQRGKVTIREFDHKRYRSVGQDGSNNRTKEYLFITEVAN